uniref:WGS project CBMF000000000 data, contig CS5834_c000299 n=1 Tax=Fusarium pseudograminearum CS5834 TaxID=1318459 RepID=A0A096PEU6_FUSPS|nr:unnamed protein product [Fusarium pseudograminearum CS5834]
MFRQTAQCSARFRFRAMPFAQARRRIPYAQRTIPSAQQGRPSALHSELTLKKTLNKFFPPEVQECLVDIAHERMRMAKLPWYRKIAGGRPGIDIV